MWLGFVSILAQGQGQGQGQKAPTGGAGTMLLIGFGLFLIVLFVMQSRGHKKQQAERQALLDSIKKNSKVMTVGGIIGTVMQTRENEVVVKVDESTNTKMTFLKSAIQKVLTDGEST